MSHMITKQNASQHIKLKVKFYIDYYISYNWP